LRQAQSKVSKLPFTGMAVTIDIGDAENIHPRNKRQVGKRLSLLALNMAYGKDICCKGPTPMEMKRDGKFLRIFFDNVCGGLKAINGNLTWFEIAGADNEFTPAVAEIVASDEIIVYNEDVLSPETVRYGWVDNPEGCNLYNSENLPAAPFCLLLDQYLN